MHRPKNRIVGYVLGLGAIQKTVLSFGLKTMVIKPGVTCLREVAANPARLGNRVYFGMGAEQGILF